MKPGGYKFQRRDSFNGPTVWDVSSHDPTNHPYRAPGGLIIPVAKTSAQRKEAERKRRADEGLVRVEVWCMPEHAPKIKALAKKLVSPLCS